MVPSHPGAPLPGPSGSVIEHLRSAINAAESDHSLRVIIDTALDAVVTMDEDGLISGWNRSAEQLFQRTRDDVMGQCLAELIIPERYRAAHTAGLKHFRDTGEGSVLGSVIEVEALRADGTQFPVELAISPAWNADGHTTFIAFVRDITHRRRRVHDLEILHRAGRQLSASLDQEVVIDAVVRLAADGVDSPLVRLYQVDGMTAVLAAELEDGQVRFVGRALQLGNDPGVTTAALTGTTWSGQIRSTHVGDGAAGPEGTHATCLPLKSGDEILGVLTAVAPGSAPFDAGQLQLLDGIASFASLAIANAARFRLECEFGERMAALEQAKTQFLNLASHELRTPLAVLVGYLSLLEDGAFGDVSPKLRAIFPVLNAKLADMNGLVNSMLETARLEDNRLELEQESADLRDIVTAAAQRVAVSALTEQQLHLDLPDTAVPVNVDPLRIQMAVGNLMGNALKYSPDGSEAQCELRAEGGSAVLRVRDHGIGIAKDDMGVLFTRFGRIRTGDTSQIPGTGLGLYLARELVRRHGGDIVAQSQLGEGSLFTLTLPLEVA
jgi:two-component system sensor histidine kinase/response regulator